MRSTIITQAKKLMTQDPVFMDTETTGLASYDEVIEICIIAADGRVLLDTLIKPMVPVSDGARSAHHITDEELETAPLFDEILPLIEVIMKDQPVVIYNAVFDTKFIQQSARTHGWTSNVVPNPVCAMLMYSEFAGEWDKYHGNYRWHKLINAAKRSGIEIPGTLHRARADTELTRQLVRYMAGIKT